MNIGGKDFFPIHTYYNEYGLVNTWSQDLGVVVSARRPDLFTEILDSEHRMWVSWTSSREGYRLRTVPTHWRPLENSQVSPRVVTEVSRVLEVGDYLLILQATERALRTPVWESDRG